MDFHLNSNLDLEALAKGFKKSNRVQVKNALDEKSADALSETIEKMAIWRWVFLDRNSEWVMRHCQRKVNRHQKAATHPASGGKFPTHQFQI